MERRTLKVMPWKLAVCKLPADARKPELEGFYCIMRTQSELSIVCEERHIPAGAKTEKGWRALGVEGTLDFGLTGILSSIASPLADAKISIFAISTFDTDYVLVKEEKLEAAIAALEKTFDIIR